MDSDLEAIIATSAVFTAIAGVSLAVRFWTRHVTSAGYAADDWLAVASFGFSTALAVTNILSIPMENVSDAGYQSQAPVRYTAATYLKVFFVAQFWFVAAVATTKLSILYLLKRIFSSSRTPWSIWVMIWLTICWAISFLTATFFQILPTSSGVISHSPSTNYPWIYLISAITDLVLDVIILCLPIVFVRRLQMPLTKKICVGGIFSLGLFCVIASITRLYYTWSCIHMDMDGDYSSDFNTSADNLLMWSAIEACVSVTCVNLPTFGAIFSVVSQRFSKHYSEASVSDHDSIIEDANLDLSERSWYGIPETRPHSEISESTTKRSSYDVRSLSLHSTNGTAERVPFWKRFLKKPVPLGDRCSSGMAGLKGLRYSRTLFPKTPVCEGHVPVSPIVEMSVVRTGNIGDAEFKLLPCSPVEAAVRMSR